MEIFVKTGQATTWNKLAAAAVCMGLMLLAIPWASLANEEAEIRVLLIPERESELASQLNAEITEITVKEGDRFEEGSTLVEFDCAVINARLQKVRFDLEAAQETHEANLELERYGSVSQLDTAVSSAMVKRAQAEVLVNETIAGKCSIKAPYSGRVVKLEATPFQHVSQGDAIMEIIDEKSLLIRLLLPSTWLRWIKPGIHFKVQIDETLASYEAVLVGLGAKVNPVNQTIEAFGRFTDLSPDLLAGMSGTAVFSPPKTIKKAP